jgi:hypothetical protein
MRAMPLVVVGAVLAACTGDGARAPRTESHPARTASPAAAPASPAATPMNQGLRLPPEFWENPIGNGVAIDDPLEAGLVFIPDVPDDLGLALRILVTPEDAAPAPYREIAWVYEHPQYGRFVIKERIASGTGVLAEIAELASHTPGCVPLSPVPSGLGEGAYGEVCHHGERSLITLGSGVTALMVVGENTTFVQWIVPLEFPTIDDEVLVHEVEEYSDGALFVRVIGPTPDFSPEDAGAVANGV